MNLITALIVDDSLFMRKFIGEVVEDIGCTDIYFAKDGIEALRMSMKLKPDLVTLNITMPNMNGIDVIEKMLEISPESKIIMISAIHDGSTVQRAMNKGIVSYIPKPFERNSLKGILRYHFKC